MGNRYLEYLVLAPLMLGILLASFQWQNGLDFTINVCSAYVAIAAIWFGDMEFPKNKLKAVTTNLTIFGVYSVIVIFSTNITLEDIF